MTALPLIGLICDQRMIGAHPFHAAGDKYVRAVSHGAGCMPVLIPALGAWWQYERLLERLDGLLFTGSPSNLHTRHYGLPDERITPPLDPDRDATSLPLWRAALSRDMPILAICRGFQEMNVALGGSLHPQVQNVPGMADHREPEGAALEAQYAPAHPVSLTTDGLLARLTGQSTLMVNSLHQQGIDRLADDLVAEAQAPDGLVEAARYKHDSGFVLGMQWHPEWRFWENPAASAILAAFGEAARSRMHSNSKS
jgi:putative glutamine amidotransferase